MRLIVVSALVLSAALAGCGGKEARLAEHLAKAKEHYHAGRLDKARVELKNVLQIDPKSAEGYLYAGLVEERTRNLQRAFASYAKALELDPGLVPAHVKVGHFYLLAGDLANARSHADAALARAPGDAGAQLLDAAIVARGGDAEKAAQAARRVIAAHPGQSEAYALVAGIELGRGRRAEAAAMLEEGMRADPADVELRLARIQLAADEKAWTDAERVYRELVALQPKEFTHRVGLARLYVTMERPEDAEKTLREAAAADPADSARVAALADFLVGRGRAALAEEELKAALLAHPDAHALRFSLAGLERALERPAEAAALHEETIRRDKTGPDGLRARLELAGLAMTADRTGEARRLLGEVLKENPRDAGALVLRARLALARGDAPAAIIDLRSVLRDTPRALDVAGLLARAHLANREPQLAIETIDQATSGDERPPARLLVAEVRVAAGDLEGTARELATVLKAEPTNAAALAARASLEAGQHKWAEAERTLFALVKAHPSDPQAHYRLGAMYQAQGRPAKAIEAFEAALKLAPGAIEPLTGMVGAEAAQKQLPRAVARLQRELAGRPDDFALRALLGRALERAGRLPEAEAAFAEAAREQPKLAAAQLEHASFQMRRGAPRRAAETAEAALKAIPGNAGLMQLAAEGWRLAREGERAITAYEKILELRPQDPLATNNLANLLVDLRGDRKSLERALELTRGLRDAANPAFADTLGWVYVKLGRVEEGLPLLRRAAEGAPAAPEIQFHLGYALQSKGERGAAQAHLRKALESDRDFPGKEQARLLLDS